MNPASCLRKFLAACFYPTNSEDWYKSKGYGGEDEQEQFSQFLSSQTHEESSFYDEFKSLDLRRQFIQSGGYKLDSVLLIPQKTFSLTRNSENLYFVFFQGRGEFYESRLLCARYFSPPLRQKRSPLHTNFFAALCHPPF